MNTLQEQTIAFLAATEGTEQIELTAPWQAVLEAGGTPRLVSTEAGWIHAFNHLDRADTFPVDAVAGSRSPESFDGLVLPGGVANPDALRLSKDAVEFVRGFFRLGKPVAAICHAAWTLIEAEVVRGRTLTSWPSLRTDLVNAGAHWVDEPVVVCRDGDNTLITSRKPDDLDAFNDSLVTQFATAAPAKHITA